MEMETIQFIAIANLTSNLTISSRSLQYSADFHLFYDFSVYHLKAPPDRATFGLGS